TTRHKQLPDERKVRVELVLFAALPAEHVAHVLVIVASHSMEEHVCRSRALQVVRGEQRFDRLDHGRRRSLLPSKFIHAHARLLSLATSVTERVGDRRYESLCVCCGATTRGNQSYISCRLLLMLVARIQSGHLRACKHARRLLALEAADVAADSLAAVRQRKV